MRIEGASAVVTGAGSGLGAATARAIAAAGGAVTAVDLNIAGAERTLGSFEPGTPAQAVACDVTSAHDVAAMMEKAASRFGPVRILVNCAGVLGSAQLLRKDGSPRELAPFRAVLNVNLIGTFNCIWAFARAHPSSNPGGDEEAGVVISTSSVAATEALSGQVGYGASKGGVSGMMLPLARAYADKRIRAVAIAPGVFETGISDKIPDHTLQSLIGETPFPKRLGRPEEFAQFARAIIENTMINGSVLRIDGALRMSEPTKDRGHLHAL